MKNNYIQRFEKYLELGGYSKENTIKPYSKILYDFLLFCNDPNLATSETLIEFALTKNSKSHRKQTQGVFKHFFKAIVPKPEIITLLPKIKKDSKIPQILTVDEVKRLLDKTINVKHKAMLSVLYYSAVRSEELLNLKVENINGTDFEIHIQNGKGSKDRVIPIPENLIKLLRVYYKKYKPKEYLFSGQIKINKYSYESLNKVVKQALKRAHIIKHITCHSFRHSRATHLLNNGVDTKTLQDFLGHKHISSTEVYLHISKAQMRKIIFKADNLIKNAA